MARHSHHFLIACLAQVTTQSHFYSWIISCDLRASNRLSHCNLCLQCAFQKNMPLLISQDGQIITGPNARQGPFLPPL